MDLSLSTFLSREVPGGACKKKNGYSSNKQLEKGTVLTHFKVIVQLQCLHISLKNAIINQNLLPLPITLYTYAAAI